MQFSAPPLGKPCVWTWNFAGSRGLQTVVLPFRRSNSFGAGRNEALNANNFFANATGVPRGEFPRAPRNAPCRPQSRNYDFRHAGREVWAIRWPAPVDGRINVAKPLSGELLHRINHRPFRKRD